MRGQISIEMILVLAAILAVAFILVTQLQKTATKGGEMIENSSSAVFQKISETQSGELLESGEVCEYDDQCKSGTCTMNICD